VRVTDPALVAQASACSSILPIDGLKSALQAQDRYMACGGVKPRGIILNNNTFANNSNVADDCGNNVGKGVEDAVINGNVFHLKSDTRYKVDPAATDVVIDSKKQ
jgi:hypothetical protein